jgi:ABC-type siderophore export system fused ATPase/permease subunit
VRAIVIVAASLHPARKVFSALAALRRVGDAIARIEALTATFPAAEAGVSPAPARWRLLAVTGVRVGLRDTPDSFIAPAGPLDTALHSGEIVALTGSDLGGRRTLIHVLCGLIPPDEGTITLDGRPAPAPLLRGLCGAMLDPGELPTGVPGDMSRAAVLFSRFELALPAAWPPDSDLGPMERIRLAIVATELMDRAVRVYDESATRLDPRFRDAFADTLREARARGRTCVVATNDPAVIAIADRVLRMDDGLLVPVAGVPL